MFPGRMFSFNVTEPVTKDHLSWETTFLLSVGWFSMTSFTVIPDTKFLPRNFQLSPSVGDRILVLSEKCNCYHHQLTVTCLVWKRPKPHRHHVGIVFSSTLCMLFYYMHSAVQSYTAVVQASVVYPSLNPFSQKLSNRLHTCNAKFCGKVPVQTIFSSAWLCQQSSWNPNLSVVHPSVHVAIISEPKVRISFKFWLLLSLGHTPGLFFLFFTNIFRFC